jgi:ABC-type transport system substrate-binding protein
MTLIGATDGYTASMPGPLTSRRTFVATAAAAAGMAAAGPASAATDTLVWDIAAGPQYVDPPMGKAAQANVMVVQNVYERLVWYDGANMKPIPWLASSWAVEADGRR